MPGNKLIFRFNHDRDATLGAVISNGIMQYKLTEWVKADPLGLGGKIDAGEVFIAGQVLLEPVFESE